MPIISIIEQPATNALKAAYRPIVFVVRASRTDGNAKPPIVYCDIYVDGIYYKSQERTIYKTLNATNSDWQFDIMDAVQEVLSWTIPQNGGTAIVADSLSMKNIYCKFRSSGYDVNSFIAAEGTAPVQGTGTVAPVAGTGSPSNTFFVCNSTLQHDHNQDLAAHLDYYKSGTWDSLVYPLTHRPNGYRVCKGDSDYFPISNVSAKTPLCVKLFYKNKGDSGYSSVSKCGDSECIAVNIPTFIFPDAAVGSSYSKSIAISGTAPFTLASYTVPNWMAVELSGNNLIFSGTPASGDIGTGESISVTVTNACGNLTKNGSINVSSSSCVNVGISGSPSLPNGTINTSYSYSFNLTGTGPFALGTVTKPGWMNDPVISGSTVTLSGYPTATGKDETVSIQITNCSSGSATFTGSLSIGAQITGQNTPINDDACTTTYELSVVATEGDSLLITSEIVHGSGTIEPTSPLTITYSGSLTYDQTLLNANGAGFSRINFTVLNNTTGVSKLIQLTRNNNSAPC